MKAPSLFIYLFGEIIPSLEMDRRIMTMTGKKRTFVYHENTAQNFIRTTADDGRFK